jgi:peptidoglycan/xylan/chitin deacetylase (PgdA/CDA1 family)
MIRHAPASLILTYHRIADATADPWGLCVSPGRFSAQLEVLTRGWHLLSVRELTAALAQGSLPDRSVAITFDDGYADNLDEASPALERHRVPATVFLVTGEPAVRRTFWWDELADLLLLPGRLPTVIRLRLGEDTLELVLAESADYGPEDAQRHRGWRAWQDAPTKRHAAYRTLWQALQALNDQVRQQALDGLRALAPAAAPVTARRLSADEVVALSRRPRVDIGAHTVTHPSLASLPAAAQRREIEQSRADLVALLAKPIDAFAYPFGAPVNYTSETVDLVRQGGFVAACTTEAAPVTPASDRWRLPRFQVEDWNAETFTRRLAAWMG